MSANTTDTTQQPKRGRGRPRTDPAGVQNTHGVKLSPSEVEFLQQLGGSVSGGVRVLVTRAMARKRKPG